MDGSIVAAILGTGGVAEALRVAEAPERQPALYWREWPRPLFYRSSSTKMNNGTEVLCFARWHGGVAGPTAPRGHVLLQFVCSRKGRETVRKLQRVATGVGWHG
jgi:hypothetical protein